MKVRSGNSRHGPSVLSVDGIDYVPRRDYDRQQREVANYARAARKSAKIQKALKRQVQALHRRLCDQNEEDEA